MNTIHEYFFCFFNKVLKWRRRTLPTHISDNKLSLKNDTGKLSDTGSKSNEKKVGKVVGYPLGVARGASPLTTP